MSVNFLSPFELPSNTKAPRTTVKTMLLKFVRSNCSLIVKSGSIYIISKLLVDHFPVSAASNVFIRKREYFFIFSSAFQSGCFWHDRYTCIKMWLLSFKINNPWHSLLGFSDFIRRKILQCISGMVLIDR